MANMKLFLVGALLLAVCSLASCNTSPSTFLPWKGMKTRTLTLTDGDFIAQVPKANADAVPSTPVIYMAYVKCGEMGTNSGAVVGTCKWSGIFLEQLAGDNARIMWHGDCTLEKACGRFGTGSIVFQGVAGGLENWTSNYDLPVTGGCGAFFGVTGVRTNDAATSSIRFRLVAPTV